MTRTLTLYVVLDSCLCRQAIAALNGVRSILPRDVGVSIEYVNPKNTVYRRLPALVFRVGRTPVYRVSGAFTQTEITNALRSLG